MLPQQPVSSWTEFAFGEGGGGGKLAILTSALTSLGQAAALLDSHPDPDLPLSIHLEGVLLAILDSKYWNVNIGT